MSISNLYTNNLKIYNLVIDHDFFFYNTRSYLKSRIFKVFNSSMYSYLIFNFVNLIFHTVLLPFGVFILINK